MFAEDIFEYARKLFEPYEINNGASFPKINHKLIKNYGNENLLIYSKDLNITNLNLKFLPGACNNILLLGDEYQNND